MRRMILALIAVGVLVGAASPLFAQLAANEVYVGQSFQVAGTHDGVNVTNYRLYRNGTLVQTLSASARNTTTGDVLFGSRTESAVGSFTYEMAAVNINTSGEAESQRLAVTLVVKIAPPTAPAPLTLPRIIRVPLS